MNISYKGVKTDLSPKLQGKLDAKFAKVSKLLEKRGEREAHVVVTSERHLHHAEITLQFYDHQLVSICTDADLFTSLSNALDKLEQQALKQRTKWREKTRRSGPSKSSTPELVEPQSGSKADGRVQTIATASGGGKNSARRNSDTNGAKLSGSAAKNVAKNAAKGVAESGQRVYRINHHEQRKPMTLDEALLEMEGGHDYLVYRDTENESISVLVRRRDGHFDLIES